MVKQLFIAAGGSDGGKRIKIAQLVRYVMVQPSQTKNFNYKSFLKTFASKVTKPIRGTLKKLVTELGHDNDELITKEEFLNAFQSYVSDDKIITKWTLACLFCHLDELDGMDDRIKFETLVKEVEEALNLKYGK